MDIDAKDPITIPAIVYDKFWVTNLVVASIPKGQTTLSFTVTPYNDAGDVNYPAMQTFQVDNFDARILSDVNFQNFYSSLNSCVNKILQEQGLVNDT